MNKQRVEHIEQLYLSAGVVLYRAMKRAGITRGGELRPHSTLGQWAKGDRYTYRDRGKVVRDVTIDTLKDALLTRSVSEWKRVAIAVVEEPSVVRTTNSKGIPEGATHYREGAVGKTTIRLYYKKDADGGWLFYNRAAGNWWNSLLFYGERGLTPLYNDDPTKTKSDSKWVSAFERGESFARSGLDVMSNPYTTEVARQEFFAGYAAYQRRTVNHG